MSKKQRFDISCEKLSSESMQYFHKHEPRKIIISGTRKSHTLFPHFLEMETEDEMKKNEIKLTPTLTQRA